MRRSSFLAVLAAAATPTLPYKSLAASSRTPAGSARVRLGYIGNVCEAVTVTAPTSLAFLNERLAAERVRFESEDALAAALHAGTIEAASMNLPSLIGALDGGCQVRVAAGLHTGCMSVLARDAFAFYGPRDLKGQTIGTDRFDGPAMHLLMAILAKQGLDPHRDVKWRGYSSGELDSALQAHVVNCVAVSDPIAYELQTAHRVEPFLDTAGGGFSCGNDIATGHHCFLALAGSLVERRPALAAALTRAYLNSSAAFGGSLDSLQLDGFYGPFRAGRGETLGMLASYEWQASTDFVVEELELTARDFQRAGLLQTTTDPMAFAQRAVADLQDV
jgi:NitT/TauT family transport system substrate-binding protein